ncbi:MAG: glycosyltransferase [Bacteroidia bacterium]
MAKKRVIAVLVSNDLATDQRVLKVCKSLIERAYTPVLIGRIKPDSMPMPELNFKTIRMNLLFTSGPLFYAMLNLRLFFKLLFLKMDGIHANDLDTLLPAYLISKIRSKPLVYDTHEYFTGVPELQSRPSVQKIWRSIESYIFPKLKQVITVNDSIANLYDKDYGVRPSVMRNIPNKTIAKAESKTRKDLGFSEDSFLIILQGSGINVDRGAEEAVWMMQELDACVLIIAGSGDVINQLKKSTSELGLEEKVRFFPRMPYSEMMGITRLCDLGLTLDKDTNINYRFSLPNKLFDYIHAGIPVLASDLTEVRKIIESYSVGRICSNHEPLHLASMVKSMKDDKVALANYRVNCQLASADLTWENEAKTLNAFYP